MGNYVREEVRTTRPEKSKMACYIGGLSPPAQCNKSLAFSREEWGWSSKIPPERREIFIARALFHMVLHGTHTHFLSRTLVCWFSLLTLTRPLLIGYPAQSAYGAWFSSWKVVLCTSARMQEYTSSCGCVCACVRARECAIIYLYV